MDVDPAQAIAEHTRQEVQDDASAAEAAAWLAHPTDSPKRAAGWRELIEQWTNEPEWKDPKANDHDQL